MRRVVLVSLALLFVGGCGLLGTTPLEMAARAASGWSVVASVNHHPADFLDEEALDVWLVPGASRSEVIRLWCEVLVPNGATDQNTIVETEDGLFHVDQPPCGD